MQVGNYTLDQDYWGRPEDYDLDRPYYIAGDAVGATNLAATMCSALAATALVWKSSDTAYYTTLMTAATSLYAYATKVYGAYGDGVSFQLGFCMLCCSVQPVPYQCFMVWLCWQSSALLRDRREIVIVMTSVLSG